MFLSSAILLTQLLGCRAPFEGDRHTLEGFRIAALSASSEGSGAPVAVSAAVVVEGRLWHDDPVAMSWYWLDAGRELGEIDGDRVPDGVGAHPDLVMPAERRTLGLIAEADRSYRAFVEIAEGDAAPVGFGVDASVASIAPGDKAVLSIRFDGEAPTDAHARWMATDGRFSEIDALSTNWKAPGKAGVVTFLPLILDDAGQSAWHLSDHHVGEAELGLWVGERWLPSDLVLEPGRYDVVLTADDGSSSGVRVSEATPSSGGRLPACAPVAAEVFSLRWLADGSCTRLQVIDEPIALDVL